MNKKYGQVDLIRQKIMSDPMNASYTRRGVAPLFKVSSLAKVVIIGQAPGQKAESTNLFWNDPSGDRLREWMRVSKEEFYSLETLAQLPMDFYFPGKGKTGDNPPRKDFANKWHEILLDLMPEIQLKILVGSYSQRYYLGGNVKKNLTETVKAYRDYLPDFFPIVHPSPLNIRWLKQNPWFELEVIPEFQKIVKSLI